jgi:succinate-acetate transporter protein
VLGFVVPLQLIACVLAFLARDTVAGTSLGLFAGAWLATSLAMLTAPPGSTSGAQGAFLLCVGGGFVVLIAGASFGKLGPALVMVAGGTRFIVSGLFEITGSTALEHAGAIVGLVLAAAALYSALATEIEDVQGETKLPLLRRNLAAAALDAPFETQLTRIEHEAGVRQQL